MSLSSLWLWRWSFFWLDALTLATRLTQKLLLIDWTKFSINGTKKKSRRTQERHLTNLLHNKLKNKKARAGGGHTIPCLISVPLLSVRQRW
jgi:hypothetical protein